MQTQHQFKNRKKRAEGKIPVNIFFRSSANGWSLDNQFMEYANNCYICRNVKLPEGKIEFKIADEFYKILNFGNSTVKGRGYTQLMPNAINNAEYINKRARNVDIYLQTNKDFTISIFFRG